MDKFSFTSEKQQCGHRHAIFSHVNKLPVYTESRILSNVFTKVHLKSKNSDKTMLTEIDN